jgi:hypothetical protein
LLNIYKCWTINKICSFKWHFSQRCHYRISRAMTSGAHDKNQYGIGLKQKRTNDVRVTSHAFVDNRRPGITLVLLCFGKNCKQHNREQLSRRENGIRFDVFLSLLSVKKLVWNKTVLQNNKFFFLNIVQKL